MSFPGRKSPIFVFLAGDTIKNIKGLVQVRPEFVPRVEGKAMQHLPVLEDAFRVW